MKKHLKKHKSRPLSWSSISSFQWDREQWANKYLLDIIEPPNKAMRLGLKVHELLSVMPINGFRPDVPRSGIPNFKIEAKLGKIPLVGYLDFWNEETKEITEFKTHEKLDKWTTRSSTSWGQLKFYTALLYITHDIQPEEITSKLIALRTENFKLLKEPCKVFTIRHNKLDVTNFLIDVKDTYQKMCDYALDFK